MSSEGATTISEAARKASRRCERSALSVDEEAQTRGSVGTLAGLQGGEGRASLSESTFEIDAVQGAPESIGDDCTDEAVEGERSEAIRAAGPISGDTVRTSVSESEVSEEGSRDILKAKLKAVWAKVESNIERARSTTAINSELRQENHADANFIMIEQDLHDETHAYSS